jgi:hypothetical protein
MRFSNEILMGVAAILVWAAVRIAFAGGSVAWGRRSRNSFQS